MPEQGVAAIRGSSGSLIKNREGNLGFTSRMERDPICLVEP